MYPSFSRELFLFFSFFLQFLLFLIHRIAWFGPEVGRTKRDTSPSFDPTSLSLPLSVSLPRTLGGFSLVQALRKTSYTPATLSKAAEPSLAPAAIQNRDTKIYRRVKTEGSSIRAVPFLHSSRTYLISLSPSAYSPPPLRATLSLFSSLFSFTVKRRSGFHSREKDGSILSGCLTCRGIAPFSSAWR